jgi:hypothetical protein
MQSDHVLTIKKVCRESPFTHLVSQIITTMEFLKETAKKLSESNSNDETLALLKELNSDASLDTVRQVMTADLKSSGVGVQLQKLIKSEDKAVSGLATEVVDKWKKSVKVSGSSQDRNIM